MMEGPRDPLETTMSRMLMQSLYILYTEEKEKESFRLHPRSVFIQERAPHSESQR